MTTYLITIDGGTTNTRAFLWNRNGQTIAAAKSSIGIHDVAEIRNSNPLRQEIRHLILSLLQKKQINEQQISAIYASGMITSNMGLAEIPHLIAPVSLEDFAAHVVLREIPQISPLPIHFIPGMKNMSDSNVSLENLESMDIMRGEETEALALLDQIDQKKDCLLVLPGSHMKFVYIDANSRLAGCLTSLSGEILSALTKHTILADAVDRKFVDQNWNSEYLLAGFQSARTTSLSRAAFLTRIVHQFLSKNTEYCASFLLGSILENDITAIKSSKALKVQPHTKIYLAGKEPFCSALLNLFMADGYFRNIEKVTLPDWRPMAGYGALLLARKRGDFSILPNYKN